MEIAIAETPISGDLAAAAGKPEFKEMIRVALSTVIRPERIPAKAPALVVIYESNCIQKRLETWDRPKFRAFFV